MKVGEGQNEMRWKSKWKGFKEDINVNIKDIILTYLQ